LVSNAYLTIGQVGIQGFHSFIYITVLNNQFIEESHTEAFPGKFSNISDGNICNPAVGQSTGFDYSRLQNPMRQQDIKLM